MKNLSKLAVLGAAFAVSALFAASTVASADAIPYPNVGTIITGPNTLFATGASSMYFYGFNAADTDYLDVFDVTNHTDSGWMFDNQTTTAGFQVNMATTAGDVLVIEIWNQGPSYAPTLNDYFYSNGAAPAGSYTCLGLGGIYGTGNCTGSDGAPTDNQDHTYFTAYSGGTIGTTAVGPGVFVGVEDLPNYDWDYNDDQFVLTGVTTSRVPEPNSLMLLGTGLMGAAGLLFRRRLQTV